MPATNDKKVSTKEKVAAMVERLEKEDMAPTPRSRVIERLLLTIARELIK